MRALIFAQGGGETSVSTVLKEFRDVLEEGHVVVLVRRDCDSRVMIFVLDGVHGAHYYRLKFKSI
jgi:hypothetical protein